MVGYVDKALPTQPFHCNQFTGKDYETTLAKFLTGFASSYENGLAVQKPDHIDLEGLSSPPLMLAFLRFIVSVTGARRILEVGTFVGLTTMLIAGHAGPDCHITTIERGHEFALMAEQNIAANGLNKQITVIEGEADLVLENLIGTFDLIFLDGGKQDYPDLAARCERLLSKKGVLVVDDVFFHGDALNAEPQTDKGLGCKAVVEQYAGRSDVGTALLPIGNGTLIVYRL